MGIYPIRKTEPVNTRYVREWIERYEEPGVTYQRRVVASEWEELRDDCFCCSCDEDHWGQLVNDPYCRNHGWMGERPCEVHGMAGSTDENGEMPMFVGEIRRRNREQSAAW